jgi:hypothetical protein
LICIALASRKQNSGLLHLVSPLDYFDVILAISRILRYFLAEFGLLLARFFSFFFPFPIPMKMNRCGGGPKMLIRARKST